MVDRLIFNTGAFHEQFVAGLVQLLDRHSEPGVFLLVFANALQDEVLWASLKGPLNNKLQQLAQEHIDKGQDLGDASEDQAIFERVLSDGLESYNQCRWQQKGVWEVGYNPFRLLRPRREAVSALSDIHKPFDPAGFHFLRPYLCKEIFWKGDVEHTPLAIYFNKFPVLTHHCILVPEANAQWPQFLRKQAHQTIWNLSDSLATSLPGVGFGYNSMGAGASVNHLHFQMFYRQKKLPIEDLRWNHLGGDRDYPIHCERFESSGQAWRAIEELHHQHKQPYNLLYRPGCCYVLSRSITTVDPWPPWSMGMGWSEMSGLFLANCRAVYDGLDENQLEIALGGEDSFCL